MTRGARVVAGLVLAGALAAGHTMPASARGAAAQGQHSGRPAWQPMPVRVAAYGGLTDAYQHAARVGPGVMRTQGGAGMGGGTGQLTGGAWLAEDIGRRGVIDNAQSTISIGTDGTISGSGGCNRLLGSATVNGTSIRLTPLSTTRMMCPPALMDQERKFLAALEATRTFRLDGPYLRFLDAGGAELIRFTRLG